MEIAAGSGDALLLAVDDVARYVKAVLDIDVRAGQAVGDAGEPEQQRGPGAPGCYHDLLRAFEDSCTFKPPDTSAARVIPRRQGKSRLTDHAVDDEAGGIEEGEAVPPDRHYFVPISGVLDQFAEDIIVRVARWPGQRLLMGRGVEARNGCGHVEDSGSKEQG